MGGAKPNKVKKTHLPTSKFAFLISTGAEASKKDQELEREEEGAEEEAGEEGEGKE